MSSALPPRPTASLIRSLQYFEAVARLGSLKSASEEFGVSQSAVSHQLRELAAVLGERLLVRSGRGIALTPQGERLAARLKDSFAALHASVEDIVGGKRRTLRLAACSSFGPGWLIPRLQSLLDAPERIDLQLHLHGSDPDLTDDVADAFVTALPVLPGFSALRILDEELVAVHAAAQRPSGLRLITTDFEDGRLGADWAAFCDLAGLRLADLQQAPWLRCSHYLFALEMARAGLGIALVPDFLAQRDLESGVLACFDRQRLPTGRTYHLCYKHARSQEPTIQALAGWMKRQLNAGSVVKLVRTGARAARSR
ncbi:MAG: LysR family transcriptional regulator [Hyphomicrobiales bacterium]